MSILVFSIGPVQGFIAQSRRTADGWVGSYLISYLAGHALAFLEKECGLTIEEPDTKDVAMYEAILAMRSSKTSPAPQSINGNTTIAALPNVLIAKVDNGDCMDFGEQAKSTALAAWDDVVLAVWSELPSLMKNNTGVKKVWNYQVGKEFGHWEFNWAWGKNSSEAFDNLSGRKGLRNFAQIEEKGDRCTVCAQHQALWDETTRTHAHRQARDVAKDNWREWGRAINDIRKAPHTLIQPDGKERLCAICLIKRLIPWTDNPVRSLWEAGKASPVQASVFPSTSTMATVIYRTELIKTASTDGTLRQALEDYLAELKKLSRGHVKRADSLDAFSCWATTKTAAVGKGWSGDTVEDLLRMDGDWYLYGEAVRNEEKIEDLDHKAIRGAYSNLRTVAREAGLKEAPIYYAVLTMDGDQMGDLMKRAAEKGLTGVISGILNKFAQWVPRTVRNHSGRTIYAGGDDVLALLSLATALDAAEAVRSEFTRLFKDDTKLEDMWSTDCSPPSISGSIVYAHHQAPLGKVLQEGHSLLTQWAKKRRDRNALAMQHFRRGGPATTFAAKWEIDGQPLVVRLGAIQDKLKKGEQQVASRFLYGLQDIAWMFEASGPFADPTNKDGEAYLKALLLKSRLSEGKSEKEREEQAEKLAKEVLTLARASVGEKANGLAVEPLLMARFLAGGGREER